MKSLEEFVNEKLKISKKPNGILAPKDITELRDMIEDAIVKKGETCSLNHIDVSNITDMTGLFAKGHIFQKFDGDISEWDVSSVTSMRMMFQDSEFTGDISDWDVSSVKDMSFMFAESLFDGDLSKWDVSSVENMGHMFDYGEFSGSKGSIGKWDVSKVKDMNRMFNRTDFNDDISDWDVSACKNFSEMFKFDNDFKCDLSSWNVNPQARMQQMFMGCDPKYVPDWAKK